jgi:hypothetical protein
MITNDDGPDGLHRLHRMLSETYGSEIPPSDYRVTIALLNNLGVSRRGIVELMSRFTRNFESQIVNDVTYTIEEKYLISKSEYFRVESALTPHGYGTLTGAPSKEWSLAYRSLDPQESCIPIALRVCWSLLLRVFPNGVEDVRDYVILLHILRDESFSAMELEILMSELSDKPKELVVKDIEAMDTILVASEHQKLLLRQRLLPDTSCSSLRG